MEITAAAAPQFPFAIRFLHCPGLFMVSSLFCYVMPVWELSSSRLDWQKLNKMPFRSSTSSISSFCSPPPGRGSLSLVRDRAPVAGRETSNRHPPHVLPLPGSPHVFDPAAGALRPACSPAEPPLSVWSSAVFSPLALAVMSWLSL